MSELLILEDLEDLRDLQEAMARNADHPLHSWEQARTMLGLTDEELARGADTGRQDKPSAGN